MNRKARRSSNSTNKHSSNSSQSIDRFSTSHMADATDSSSNTFAAALLVSSSSFLLSTGLALVAVIAKVDHHGRAGAYLSETSSSFDYSSSGAMLDTTTDLVVRWATISSICSAIGTIGILIKRSRLVRVFAIGTALDLVCTAALVLLELLATFQPTLSGPFSSFLCSALTSGELSVASSLIWKSETRVGPRGLGVELFNFGVEACEEHWRSAMIAVILGTFVAVGLRVWGTIITWDHHSALVKRNRFLEATELEPPSPRGSDHRSWYDEAENSYKGSRDPNRRRRRSSSHRSETGSSSPTSSSSSGSERKRSVSASMTTRPSRSNTLPVLIQHHHTNSQDLFSPEILSATSTGSIGSRSKSRAMSMGANHLSSSTTPSSASLNRPRLVLVPVYINDSNNPTSSSSALSISPNDPPPQYWPVPRQSRSGSSSSNSFTSRRSRSISESPNVTLASAIYPPSMADDESRSVNELNQSPALPSLASHIASAASMPVLLSSPESLSSSTFSGSENSFSSSASDSYKWLEEYELTG